ncbi:flippase [candidate division WOR-3 bacterium]|nr:flippase [candidate division WOR-3 bacterium]TET77060.1 MAG: flippase [Candidatus Cloacimonadota bacterium]
MRTVAIDRYISQPVKNFLFLIIGNGIRWILSFFVTVYLARVLGASGFGKISFAFSIFAYGVLLSDLGLTILGTREVARKKNNIDELSSNILSLRLILALLSFTILLLFSLFAPLQKDTRVLLTLYSFSIFFYAFYLDWFFRGRERMANIAAASIITQIIYVILVFSFVNQANDIIRIPFLWFAGIGAGTIFLFLIFYLTKHHFRFHVDFSLLKLSVPVGIAAIMNQVYFHFDLVTIGLIKGESDVGLYNAGFKLVTFLLSVDTAFAWVYFPMVSRFFVESKEKLKSLVFAGTKLILLFAVPLAFGGTLLAGRVINLIYGEQFTGASDAFRILIWAIPLTSIQTIFAFGLLGCNLEKKYSLGMVIGTFINIVLNLILIPFLGIKGAAAATIISEIVMLIAMFFWFKKILYVPFLKYSIKPLAATIIMLIIMLLLWRIPTVYLIICAVFVYSLVLWFLKGVTKADLKLLRG